MGNFFLVILTCNSVNSQPVKREIVFCWLNCIFPSRIWMITYMDHLFFNITNLKLRERERWTKQQWTSKGKKIGFRPSLFLFLHYIHWDCFLLCQIKIFFFFNFQKCNLWLILLIEFANLWTHSLSRISYIAGLHWSAPNCFPSSCPCYRGEKSYTGFPSPRNKVVNYT